jgi:hypothetical protein
LPLEQEAACTKPSGATCREHAYDLAVSMLTIW